MCQVLCDKRSERSDPIINRLSFVSCSLVILWLAYLVIAVVFSLDLLACSYKDDIDFDRDQYVAKAASSSERSWREVIIQQQYFSQVSHHI